MIDKEKQSKLREEYNPDGSLQRSLQLKLTELLEEFDSICTKHSIPYWIDSGTLIGAVRHGGFIPWDDDLDICILKKDLPKLRTVLCQELSSPICYKDEQTETDYSRKWGRVECPFVFEGKQHKVWIDVFFLIPSNRWCVKLVHNTYGKCFRRKEGIINDGRLKRFIGVILFPLSVVLALLVRAGGYLFCRDTLMFDYGTGFYSIRKRSDIYPLRKIGFEGILVNAPHDYDSYLKRIYGDYMKLPSVDQRLSHGVPLDEASTDNGT